MEENKNDIDELVKSIDSSFREMSLKDIVSAHENYLSGEDIVFADKEEEIKENTESENNEPKYLKVKNDEQVLPKVQKMELKQDTGEQEASISENETLKKEKNREDKLKKAGNVGNWFQTFCYINIPLFGFIYVLVLAFSKKTPEYKKEFARGYLLYKVLVWLLAGVLLYCLYKLGLGFVEGMLSFIKA